MNWTKKKKISGRRFALVQVLPLPLSSLCFLSSIFARSSGGGLEDEGEGFDRISVGLAALPFLYFFVHRLLHRSS